MSSEEWKEIDGYPDYEISNQGRVQSWKRGGPRIMSPGASSNGYLKVGLYHEGRCVHHAIHRLVAKAFVPGYADDLVVCHNDSDRQNNVYTNLRWDTISGNAVDASKLGCIPRQVLSEAEVRAIRQDYAAGGISQRELAGAYGVTHQAIRDIIIKKNYRWVA